MLYGSRARRGWVCLWLSACVFGVAAKQVSAQALPSGYAAANIGSPALAGSAAFSNGAFTVKGAGADIWGTSDQFMFAYRQASGDMTIVARVTTLQKADGWSKAGIMIRESLTGTSRHAFMLLTGSFGAEFQRRPTTGGTSLATSGGSAAAPLWLKLERRGSTFIASRSPDGRSWTVVASQSIGMGSSVYVGLAVTSHYASRYATATFDNVAVQTATATSGGNQVPTVSLVSPAAGATFTPPASIRLTATASDADGTISRVDFYSGSTLIGSETSAPFDRYWSSVPAGTYSIVAVARDNSGNSTASAPHVVTVGQASLPVTYSGTNVGNPALVGTASASNGVYTVKGAGTDIWGTSDQFMFAHRQVSGDVAVIARVATLLKADAWSKAGVMIRESLAANAKHGFMALSGDYGAEFQRRPTTGGQSVATNGGAATAPLWVKLERRGSTLTASRSADGIQWKVVGSHTISMTASVYVGLAVTSHNALKYATATFDKVSTQASSLPSTNGLTVSLTSPSDGATYAAPATIPLQATASDSDGSVSRVDFYAGSTLIGTETTAPYERSWSKVPVGTYSIVAVARDNAGNTTVSSQRTVYIRDSTLPGRAVFVPSSNHATSVLSYLLVIYKADALLGLTLPVATQNLGKPPIVNGECQADISKTIAALAPGKYVAVVQAVGLLSITNSSPSSTFTR